MPQRIMRMSNDGVNLAVSTGSGILAWAATFSVVVPILWGIYVLILIAIKLPELYEKNGWFQRGCDWFTSLFKRGRHG